MSYQPLTLSKFKGLLEAGQYTSIAGARRAIGKASAFSDSDKAAANRMIDKVFAEGEPVKTKTAAPKAAAKEPKAAKAAKAPRAVEPKAPKAEKVAAAPAAPTARKVREAAPAPQSTDDSTLLVGERIIAASRDALTTAAMVGGESTQMLTADAVQLMGRGVQLLRTYVDKEIAAHGGDAIKAETIKAETKPSSLNGAGKKTLEEVLPA